MQLFRHAALPTRRHSATLSFRYVGRRPRFHFAPAKIHKIDVQKHRPRPQVHSSLAIFCHTDTSPHGHSWRSGTLTPPHAGLPVGMSGLVNLASSVAHQSSVCLSLSFCVTSMVLQPALYPVTSLRSSSPATLSIAFPPPTSSLSDPGSPLPPPRMSSANCYLTQTHQT